MLWLWQMIGAMHENEAEREGRVVRRIPADTFGHRLILSRAERGLTIEQAGAKCGLSSQSWGGWERGRIPRDMVDVADSIADALDIDRDWLLHGGPLTAPVKPSRRLRFTYPRRSLRPGSRSGERRARRLEWVPA